MKILVATTYWTPHISGLTISAERLARTLADRGHEVTILTARFRADLPARETRNGLTVRRVPVLFRLSKGCIQPTLPFLFLALARQSDLVHLHLPQGEGGILAWLAKTVARKPVVVTYHCDLRLPPGVVNRLVDWLVAAMNRIALHYADAIVSNTEDYAVHSPLLRNRMEKVRVVSLPVEIGPPDPLFRHKLKRDFNPDEKRIVGFVGRFAAEKGIEYLLQAVPMVLDKIPNVRFALVGPLEDVVQESARHTLRPEVERLGSAVRILGPVPEGQVSAFLSLCDLLVLPSINSTESFGMVQVEAMLCGVPVVASDLPGVRVPIRMTGMGKTVPPRDPTELASAIVTVLTRRSTFVKPAETIRTFFSAAITANSYEALFAELVPGSTRSGEGIAMATKSGGQAGTRGRGSGGR
jgi:glycosyltransferase involved in cell wall biosynthesis